MTTTVPAKPDHCSLPRKKRPPTARDQAIFLAYRVTARTQTELAEDYDLSQRRISEIIKRVERWRADLIPAAEGELEPKQQQRVDRWLVHERLRCVYDRSIRAYDTQALELKTTRKGDRDGKPFHDETTRQQPPNVQLLKVALRAASDMGKLEDKPSLDAPIPGDAHQRFWQVHALLCELRRDARQRGKIAANNHNEAAYVMNRLNELLGKESASPADTKSEGVPEHLISGEPSAEDVGCVERSADTRGSDVPLTAPAEAEAAEMVESHPRVSALAPLAGHTLRDDGIASNRSNESNVAPLADTPAALAEATVNPTPETVSGNPPLESAPPPAAKKNRESLEPEPSLLERRLRHEAKLAQLRYAREHGLPCLIEFDPADGPVPQNYYHIDDFGYQPTPPPSSAEIRAQNAAYLSLLQEQSQRNRTA